MRTWAAPILVGLDLGPLDVGFEVGVEVEVEVGVASELEVELGGGDDEVDVADESSCFATVGCSTCVLDSAPPQAARATTMARGAARVFIAP
jgi:hypothetical protein